MKQDRLRRLLRLPATSGRMASDVDAEFRFHLEGRIEQFMAHGMTRDEALAEVQRRFGDAAAYKRDALTIDEAGLRQMRTMEWLSALRRETVRSVRTLSRTPSFSVIAVLTLALGIGASTAIFTVLDSVVLRPLPYSQPEELVAVLHPATVPGSGERKWGVSPGGYFHFRKNSQTLANLGIYQVGGTVVTGDREAEVVDLAVVTSTIFDVLRARPALGRLVTADDDRPDSARAVVLGYAYWQRRFGGDPEILGRRVETSEGAYEVIGVTEPGLTLPLPGPFSAATSLNGVDMDLWIPMKLDPAGPFWNNHPYVGVGRLRPGHTADDAQRELATLTAQLPDVVPNAYTAGFMKQYNFRAGVTPLREEVLGPTLPRTLWMLFAAVLLVMSIAAANVANLFLVRFEARRREVAVRTALGADRRHLAVHYIAESLALCTVACVLGMVLSWAALRGVIALAPADIPRLSSVALGPWAIAFAIGVAALVALVFGVMPLFRRDETTLTLRDEGRSSTASRGRRRVRSTLVVSQLATALVLLAAAGLLLRSFGRLREVRPGFDTSHVLAFNLALPFSEYDTREEALAFHRVLEERIRALPGVTDVGSVSYAPFEGFGTGCTTVWRADAPYAPGESTPCVSTPTAMPGFFESLRISVRGRIPTWRDVDDRTQAVVVTAALAERLWPGQDPIGRGINSNGADSKEWYQIVGVVPELRAEALDRPPTEAVFYAPTGFRINQRTGNLNDLTWTVRTSGSSASGLAPAIRGILAELNPRVPFVEPRTMDQVKSRSMARTSFVMVLLGIAAAVALSLSIVGTYGVVSYIVSQRRAEIGIRLALGATRQSVSRMVMTDSLRLGLTGAALGMLGAFVVNRTLVALLFEVSPTDPWVLALAAVVLIAFATLAALLPARRAAGTDPVEALRG